MKLVYSQYVACQFVYTLLIDLDLPKKAENEADNNYINTIET